MTAKRSILPAQILLPSKPLQLFKVSTESVAKGKVLPKKATFWEGVYVPELALIVSASVLSCGAVPFKQAMAEAGKTTLCGLATREGAPALSRLEYALLFRDDLYAPALDPAYFAKADHYWEWTSTECAPADCAWIVLLGSGNAYRGRQSALSHVRAVCASQSLDLGK